jgi:hypothetical protein
MSNFCIYKKWKGNYNHAKVTSFIFKFKFSKTADFAVLKVMFTRTSSEKECLGTIYIYIYIVKLSS